MPDDAGIGVEEHFNTHLADIESNPPVYAGFQKLMARQAMAERLFPPFADSWRRRGRNSRIVPNAGHGMIFQKQATGFVESRRAFLK
jgi:hypothetical protein